MSVHSLSSHQGLSQTMVDSNSDTETYGFSGNQGSFLQIFPWKHQRNHEHENGNYGQARRLICERIFCSSTSYSHMDQDIWYSQALHLLCFLNLFLNTLSKSFSCKLNLVISIIDCREDLSSMAWFSSSVGRYGT